VKLAEVMERERERESSFWPKSGSCYNSQDKIRATDFILVNLNYIMLLQSANLLSSNPVKN
jgi:hypothetical protein